MEKAKSRYDWVRGVAAAFFTLLYLAILIPNLWSIKQLAVYVAILIVPLACIHFGADRFRFLEIIGWGLLAGLFILVTQG
jgi:hypothetical protein